MEGSVEVRWAKWRINTALLIVTTDAARMKNCIACARRHNGRDVCRRSSFRR